jgi:hypothetical protein
MADEPGKTPKRHTVILAVCVAAEGESQDDATRIAEAGVRTAVGAELKVPLPLTDEGAGATRRVRVLHVGEVNNAVTAGWLDIGPPSPPSFGAALMARRHEDTGGPGEDTTRQSR